MDGAETVDSDDDPAESINTLFKKCLHRYRSEHPRSPIDIDFLNLTSRISQEHSPSARGHSSDVYQGQLDKRIKVAVKMLRLPIYTPQHNQAYENVFLSFFRELDQWNKLRHINVAQMLGFALSREDLALVSLWYKNGNLSQYLDSNPDASKPDLMLDIAEGLRYLHTAPHPLIHADLKPANVFINEHGVACLGDFGISIQLDEINRVNKTMTRGVVGTTPWMAPELLQEQESSFTRATDIYAMAGVFLEVYCPGKAPFYYIENYYQLLFAKIQGQIPERVRYDQLNLANHDELWNLMTRCWSKDPSARPGVTTIITHIYEDFGLRPRVIDTVANRPVADSVLYQPCSDVTPTTDNEPQFLDEITVPHFPISTLPTAAELRRQEAILKLISTTERVLHQMDQVESIAQAVLSRRPPIISPDKAAESFVVLTFSGLQRFRCIFNWFLQALYYQHRVQVPVIQEIGSVLWAYAELFADALPQYMDGISVAEERLKAEIRDNWKFRILIERVTRNMSGVRGKEESILFLPIDHLEEYLALLGTIVAENRPDDPDRDDARNAIKLIRRNFSFGMLVTWQNARMSKEPEKRWTWDDVFRQAQTVPKEEIERQRLIFQMVQKEMEWANSFENFMKDDEYFKWNDLYGVFDQCFPEFEAVYQDHCKMVERLHRMQQNEYPIVHSAMAALLNAAKEWKTLYPKYFDNFTKAAYEMIVKLGEDASGRYGIRAIIENTVELALPRLRWYLDVFLPSMEDATPLRHEDHDFMAETRLILTQLVLDIEGVLPRLKKRLKVQYVMAGMRIGPSTIVDFIGIHDLAETNYLASLGYWSLMVQLVNLVRQANQQIGHTGEDDLLRSEPDSPGWWHAFGGPSTIPSQDEWARKMERWRNMFEGTGATNRPFADPVSAHHTSEARPRQPRKWSLHALLKKIRVTAGVSRRQA